MKGMLRRSYPAVAMRAALPSGGALTMTPALVEYQIEFQCVKR
jgi:hypothetical protein